MFFGAEFVAIMLGALAGLGTEVAMAFSVTSRGPNPWDVDSFLNALRIAPQVWRALGLLDGTVNSMFRSPEVNAAVGGEATSYHQHGLAVDIKPGPQFKTVEEAARLMCARVKLGMLPDVRTVIWEPSWVHVDFFKANEPRRAPKFIRKITDAAGKVSYPPIEGV